ncbi:MarR family transcriptional regulator [Nocardioides sp. BP30]|uniref:MarR family winged helix-turn-helix transcriptional regulator n=1 Tax=Nocardioides sp. BP30 TaxID=3036374 RepID=UPI002468AA30|nr:MarR family transcriptional regulator [Nocardioides sp. BP30]WGL53918.1 MarR family transcriptional regulator [Nocardioides sp. BP30]
MEATGDLLMAAARTLRRRYGAAMARWEITPGQARALRVVCEAGALRLSAIADELRIVPRSATEVVDALQERGLVIREADPADRRATSVVPTARGRQVSALLEEARTTQAEDLLAVLAPEDRAALDRILRLIVEQ